MLTATLITTALLSAQPRLAVLDVRAGVGISPDLARGLGDALTHEVRRRNPDRDVLGAGEIRSMLEVQAEKSKLGCQDVSCLAEIGGALGADQIVTSGLNRFGDTYLFTVQLVDVRRARVVREGQERFEGNDQGALLPVVERAVASIFPGAVAPPPEVYHPRNQSRISLIYDPEIPVTNGQLSFTDTVHSIGVELSVPSGPAVRYHLQLAYIAVESASGFRVDPLTFGLAIPVVMSGTFRLEIEPTVSFLDLVAFAAQNGSSDWAFAFSSGLGIQVNFSYGPLYVFLSPLGFELRYLSILPLDDGNGGFSEQVQSGFDVTYRLRIGVGFQF